jgi:ketosteroid isomerase-like protein
MMNRLALLLIAVPCAFCSCTTPSPVPVSNLQQTPKAQAEARSHQTPKAQTEVRPQQTPKAQSEAPVAPPSPPPPVSADSYRKSLIAADLAFSQASEDRGPAEAFYEHLALEGVCLFSGDTPIEGRDAAKVRFSANPTETLTWKPRQAEVSAAGDLGYTWGTYESKISSPDKATVPATGKYAIVWKRQPDGGWKASLFVTSASISPAQKP